MEVALKLLGILFLISRPLISIVQADENSISEIVEIYRPFYTDSELKQYYVEIEKIELRLRKKLKNITGARNIINALNSYIFTDLHFKYQESLDNIGLVSPPSVIEKRTGNCIGLSTLYVCLGKKLNLPLFLVLAPNHCFVRYDDGAEKINLEMSDKGSPYSNKECVEKSKIPIAVIKNTAYLKTLRKNQVLGVLYSNLGVIYLKQKNYNSAIEVLKKSLSLISNIPETHSNLGVAFLTSGHVDEATKEFNEAIRLNPYNARSYSNLGNAYDENREYISAIEAHKKALSLEPQSDAIKNNLNVSEQNAARYYYNLGKKHFEAKEYDLAAQEWNRYLIVNPSDADVHNNLAIIYYLQMNYDLAWKHVELADKYGRPVDKEVIDALRYKSNRYY